MTVARGIRELRNGLTGDDELDQAGQSSPEIGDVAQPTK
jgi:hypothetical protein